MNFKSILKRIGALALTGALLTASASAAYTNTKDVTGFQRAATTGTLTINGDGEFYAYKLYTAIPGNKTYTYEANSKYSGMLGGVTAKQLSAYDASAVQTFLNSMMGKYSIYDIKADYTLNGKTSTTLPIGYYMVVQKSDAAVPATVTSPILVSIPTESDNAWHYAVTQKPKSSGTSLTKKIVEDTTENLVDTSTSKIGATIHYQIDSTVPAYGADVDKTKVVYSITDNPSKALTVDMDSLIVKMGTTILTNKSHYTVAQNSDGGFTILFDYSKLFAGSTVTVTFGAVLNDNAIVNRNTGLSIADYTNVQDENYNGTGNPNGAALEYTNNYYTGTTSKIRDIVTSFTTLLGVEKIDKDTDSIKLEATFTLYSDAACKDVLESFTTNSTSGLGKTSTLKPGTYYLKETIPPEGYAYRDDVWTVSITAPKNDAGQYDGSFVIKVNDAALNNPLTIGNYTNVQTLIVTNSMGFTLPGAGGVGTVLYTLGGLALVGTAGAILFLRRKKKKENE